VSKKPLIAHVLYRLETGGMEQIAVSVINGTRDKYRHAVICLAGLGAMRERIADPNVPCVSLDRRPGKDWGCYSRLWKALRELQPDLVQTYNLGTLDVAPIAWLAGTRRVVHAEHGRDIADPDGRNRKYRLMRRWLQPFIARFIAVSADLETWLRENIGIAPAKIACIRNGIDTDRYNSLARPGQPRPALGAFAPAGALLIVNVARLDAVKDQVGLLAAFGMLRDAGPELATRLRLVVVGEGAERPRLEAEIARQQLDDCVELLGNRDDVPIILAESDVFVLSSVAEGIPLTVLEGMAAGLPVVATRVGGVGEAVVDGATGTLVAPSDPVALAGALRAYVEDEALRLQHGREGRARVEKHFSLPAMLSAYAALYDGLLATHPSRARAARDPVELAGRVEH
jgi:sugar transferase (PEP-CTERM/EpsH1 system associated)